MTTVISVENGVRITDPDHSSWVKLTAVVEKAVKFTNKRLAYYQVTECPAPVWRGVFNAKPRCIDRDLVNELVVLGWEVTITVRVVEIGWARFRASLEEDAMASPAG